MRKMSGCFSDIRTNDRPIFLEKKKKIRPFSSSYRPVEPVLGATMMSGYLSKGNTRDTHVRKLTVV